LVVALQLYEDSISFTERCDLIRHGLHALLGQIKKVSEQDKALQQPPMPTWSIQRVCCSLLATSLPTLTFLTLQM
jgi:hypothetical protein